MRAGGASLSKNDAGSKTVLPAFRPTVGEAASRTGALLGEASIQTASSLAGYVPTTTNADGGAYSMHHGLLTAGQGSENGWAGTNGANLYGQYNTFGVDWELDTITFYLNGGSCSSPPLLWSV